RAPSSPPKRVARRARALPARMAGACDAPGTPCRTPGNPFFTPRAVCRFSPLNPPAVASPCFGALQKAEIIHPSRERFITDRHNLGYPYHRCGFVEGSAESLGNGFSSNFEGVLCDEQAPRTRRDRFVVKHDSPDAFEEPDVAGKPAAGI